MVSAPEDGAGLSEGRGPGRARGGSIQQRINFSPLSVDQFHLKRAVSVVREVGLQMIVLKVQHGFAS